MADLKPIHKVLQIRAILKRPFEGYGLSSSEKEILMLALRGESNALIAKNTNLPMGTVNAHSLRALKKLGTSKSELGWFVIMRVWEILK
jgi:DNA-binding NarL/FixJ family response regulator